MALFSLSISIFVIQSLAVMRSFHGELQETSRATAYVVSRRFAGFSICIIIIFLDAILQYKFSFFDVKDFVT